MYTKDHKIKLKWQRPINQLTGQGDAVVVFPEKITEYTNPADAYHVFHLPPHGQFGEAEVDMKNRTGLLRFAIIGCNASSPQEKTVLFVGPRVFVSLFGPLCLKVWMEKKEWLLRDKIQIHYEIPDEIEVKELSAGIHLSDGSCRAMYVARVKLSRIHVTCKWPW